jgi:AcrR family transcriptional regulator
MSDKTTAQLPPSMALAWGVDARGSRGPKRGLTIERIVEAGTAIAVADGITAVSMGRVAERLGVSTMALYRYVAAKDDLLELMVDAGLGSPPERRPDETWRDGLRRWAEGCRDSYRANPWALRVPISAPPLGPNNIRWLEDALVSLRDTPLQPQQKLSCVLLISGFVRSEELLLHDMLTAGASHEDQSNYGQQLASLITEREFPQVSAVLDSGALSDADGIDHEFEFGIERILDGIAALMPRPRRPR